ncbi:hypothetical protein Vretimale_11365 [Volvox reticuliferus]|uniref:Uncharacterized protein n=1 Tax=Volvox reticuliferus TaxID=1737510 RepID=A0A8J4CN82_9CHLO|nr:hypothetical protein Vretifemale_12118 [Volvox reticuliferus]GIM07146.1 hypothetical protein Vretimale_11365 [Volvox reticuliferus]
MEQQHGSSLSASKPRLLGLGVGPAFSKPPFPQLKPGLTAPSPGFSGASPRPGSLTTSGRLGSTGSGALPLRSFSRHSLSPSWGCMPDAAATTAGLCDITSAAAISPGPYSPPECILNEDRPVPGGAPSCYAAKLAKVDSWASVDTQKVARLDSPNAGGGGGLTAAYLQPQAQLQQRQRVSESVAAFLPGSAVPPPPPPPASTPGTSSMGQKLPPVQIQWLPPVAPKPPTKQRNRPVKQVQWLLPEKELEKEKQESLEDWGKWIHTGLEDGSGAIEQPPPKKRRREAPSDVSPPARRLGGLLQPVPSPSPPPLLHNIGPTGLRAVQPPSRPRQGRNPAPARGKDHRGPAARAMAVSPVPDLATLTAPQWATLERHLLGGSGNGGSATAAAEANVELSQALKMLSAYAFTAPPHPQRKRQQSQEGAAEVATVGCPGGPVPAAAAAESASAAVQPDIKDIPMQHGASDASPLAGSGLGPLAEAALCRRHGCYDPGPDDSVGSCSFEIVRRVDAGKAARCSLSTAGSRAPYSDLQTALRTHPGVVRGLWRLVGVAVGLSPAVYDCDGCGAGSSSSSPGLAEIAKGEIGATGAATETAETWTQQSGEVIATAAAKQQQLVWGACAANVLRNLAVAELVPEQLLCGVGLDTCAAALEVETCHRIAGTAAIHGLAASLLELLTALPHKLRLPSSLESNPPAIGGDIGFSDVLLPGMESAGAAPAAAAAIGELHEAGAVISSAQQRHREVMSTRPMVRLQRPGPLLEVVVRLMAGGRDVCLRLRTLAAGLLAAWLGVSTNQPAVLHALTSCSLTLLFTTPNQAPTPLQASGGAAAAAADPAGTTHGSLPTRGEEVTDLGRNATSPSADTAHSADVAAVHEVSLAETAPRLPMQCTAEYMTRRAVSGVEGRQGPLNALADLLSGRVIMEEVRREAAEAGIADAEGVMWLRLLAAWRRSDAVAAAVEVLYTLTSRCGHLGRKLVRAHPGLLTGLAALAEAAEAAEADFSTARDDPRAARCRAMLTAASVVAAEVLAALTAGGSKAAEAETVAAVTQPKDGGVRALGVHEMGV